MVQDAEGPYNPEKQHLPLCLSWVAFSKIGPAWKTESQQWPVIEAYLRERL